jgi:putative FmdB family regulatory protein
MPLYDFKCVKCATRFEQLVRMDESPQCPKCGAHDPQRLFSSTAAVSTGKTREKAMKGARARAGATKREKDHAHSQYLAQHMKDHS